MKRAKQLRHRCVDSEWLDSLPGTDPRAVGSRADLRRVNTWMGNAAQFIRVLEQEPGMSPPHQIVELGAGDGSLLWDLAKRMSDRWPSVEAVLVDRLNIVPDHIIKGFQALGWMIRVVQAEVFDWLNQAKIEKADIILTNLFLHHFIDAQLRILFQHMAERTRWFVACEPERSWPALAGTRLLRFIGCNDVTRHDARISVRAGFQGNELIRLWPNGNGWRLQERPAGLFSHLFIASKLSGGSK